MYVFNFNPATKAYTGGTRADFDQLKPGRILVPYGATTTPPPKHDTATHWPFYNQARDAWELRPQAGEGAL